MVEEDCQRVVIVDFQMPFGSIVKLMVKWAIAAIPALLILTAFFATSVGIIAGILAALDAHSHH